VAAHWFSLKSVPQQWWWQRSGWAAIASGQKHKHKLECGQMPNVMVALPNTGGALCSTPQSLADADY